MQNTPDRAGAVGDQPEITIAQRRYRWEDVALPGGPGFDWAHHGVVATPDGDLVSGIPSGDGFFSLSTRALTNPTLLGLTETHGLGLDARDGVPTVWIADNGRKEIPLDGPGLRSQQDRGRVVRVALDGTVVQEIDASALPEEYRDWHPCSVAADDSDPAGDIWVADGYGLSLLHCFDAEGRHRWTVDGSDSGTLLSTPHAVVIDRRGPSPLVLVADRGNRRLIWFTPGGSFVRAAGDEVLTSPSGLAFEGERLWITELFGGLVVFGPDDQVVATVGDREFSQEPGWPNVLDDDAVRRPPVVPGAFRSPHGIAVDSSGRVAVTEWIVGGRLVVLTPVS